MVYGRVVRERAEQRQVFDLSVEAEGADGVGVRSRYESASDGCYQLDLDEVTMHHHSHSLHYYYCIQIQGKNTHCIGIGIGIGID